MKNTKIFLFTLLALCLAMPLMAQTATTRTTLAAALTDAIVGSNAIIQVASASGMSATSPANGRTLIMVDGELMQVRTISGTNVTVIRGVGGTPSGHLSGAVVWYGLTGNWNNQTGNSTGVFLATDPIGRCTRTNNLFLPIINASTGNIFDCILSTTATTATWTKLNVTPGLTQMPPYKLLAVTATTYTLLVNDEILGYNTNVGGTITLPSISGLAGKRYTIQLETNGTHTVGVMAPTSETINTLPQGTAFVLGWASQATGEFYYNGAGKWFVNNR